VIRRTIKPSGVRFRKSISKWSKKMKGFPVFIIGNAPSLNDFDLSKLDGFFTIGINRSLYKIDSTILLWQDKDIYHYEKRIIDKSNSLKVCRDIADPLGKFFHFKLKTGFYKRSKDPSVLYGRGSSGPLSVQFADALGCSSIYLLGMDCVVKNGDTDFYGKNIFWKKHTKKNCLTGLKWIESSFSDKKIYNLSKRKDLDYNKIITKNKKYKKGRNFYIKKLLS
jgi:hypothetical protein|tara:strand:+ start:1572 stop:2240 length:669 start_codon:yes stop_codon:yes gene_type:complete